MGMVCGACSGTSDVVEPMLDLSLELRGDTLLDALHHFCQTETLADYRCERCKSLQTATKRLTVEASSHALVVHLKRFAFSPNGASKIDRSVAFGERLNLAPFLSAPSTAAAAAAYRLSGIIVHDGYTALSGHYYAFVRGANNTWYEMNDETVRTCSLETVLRQKAYILFYEKETDMPLARVPPPPQPLPQRITLKSNSREMLG